MRRTKRCSRCKRNVDQRDLIARQRQHFAALRVGKARRRIENIRARPQSDIKLPLFRRQRARGEHRLQSRGKDALPTLRQRIKRIEHLGANRLLARLTRCQSLHPLQDRRPHPRLRRLIAQRNFGAQPDVKTVVVADRAIRPTRIGARALRVVAVVDNEQRKRGVLAEIDIARVDRQLQFKLKHLHAIHHRLLRQLHAVQRQTERIWVGRGLQRSGRSDRKIIAIHQPLQRALANTKV